MPPAAARAFAAASRCRARPPAGPLRWALPAGMGPTCPARVRVQPPRPRYIGSQPGELAGKLASKWRTADAEAAASKQLPEDFVDKLCAAVAQHGGSSGASIQWAAVAEQVGDSSTADNCRSAWRGMLRDARRQKELAAGGVPSPCVKVCKLDKATAEMCYGCFRDLHEITAWTQMGPDERKVCLEDASVRRKEYEAVHGPCGEFDG